jgi:outer membrane protein W
MIMATDLLEMRIKEIREENRQRAVAEGLNPDNEDLDPTLAEIAETHIIHYQSKFKPFVAIGMEY